MQQSPDSRPISRWLRLALLILGIGALALLGAMLGNGLSSFGIDAAAARRNTAAPTAVMPLLPTTRAADEQLFVARRELPTALTPTPILAVEPFPIADQSQSLCSSLVERTSANQADQRAVRPTARPEGSIWQFPYGNADAPATGCPE